MGIFRKLTKKVSRHHSYLVQVFPNTERKDCSSPMVIFITSISAQFSFWIWNCDLKYSRLIDEFVRVKLNLHLCISTLTTHYAFNFLFVGGGSSSTADFAAYKLRSFYIFLLCCSLLSTKTVMDVRRTKRALVAILERKGKQLFFL